MRRKKLKLLRQALLTAGALTFVWLLTAATTCVAQDDATRATARQLAVEGIDAYHANEIATAEQKLDRAYQLFATPTLGLWSARARIKAGHWVEGAERLREAMRGSPEVGDVAAQRQALQDASAELDALTPRLPTLTLEVEGAPAAEVTLKLDGAALPSGMLGLARPTNPGTHQLVATRGAAHISIMFQLAEAERKRIPLQFPAASEPAVATSPAAPADAARAQVAAPLLSPAAISSKDATQVNPLRPVAVVALSLGGVGLAGSAVAALIGKGKRDGCTEREGIWYCASEDQAGAYNSARTISTVTFYLGAAFAVGGLATWLLASNPPSQPASDVAWSVGPGSVSVHGRF